MKRIDTLIIGGGQAGLAMSACLSQRGVEHVIVERGRVGERWRSERWDSLRLLTPNWQSRLPGWSYRGPDPNGYMTSAEVIQFLEGYAESIEAPVQEQTEVHSVELSEGRFLVSSSRGRWSAANLVIATGYCDRPNLPEWERDVSDDLLSITPSEYRNAGQLPHGGVLVVGASATGIQLAEEIHNSGRKVVLAVGRHTRLPRRYRGKDILWWFERLGILNQRRNDVYDFDISREQPSMQLVGKEDHTSLDLPMLQKRGIRLTGRATGVEEGSRILFDGNLVAYTAAADAKLAQLLTRIDKFVDENNLEKEVDEPDWPEPFFWPATAPTELDLKDAGIKAILWATGFRRTYPWLKIPVLDGHGEIIHEGGVTPVPGLYVLGMQFLRRRNSAFIDGVGKDAVELTAHLLERDRGAGGRRVA